jgi:thiol:disulfide interchange protein DsbD
VKGESVPVRAKVEYIACTDMTCFPPATDQVEAALQLAPAGSPVQATHPELFAARAPASPAAGGSPGAGSSSDFEKKVAENPLGALLFCFLGGILASLTPCVYPMIPVPSAYCARGPPRSRAKTLALALTYVFGICVTYSSLGLVSGLAGQTFGAWLGNPWVLGALAAFVYAMGLSMFGLFEVQAPAFIRNRAGAGAKAGFLGALFMGLVLGLVAAPCVGPALVAALAWIAKTRDPVLGTLFLFTFALGMGVLFIVLAMGAKFLPRSGGWMDKVKVVMGVALFGVALYFLSSGFSTAVVGVVALLTALGLAAYFLRPTREPSSEGARTAGSTALGLLFVLLAVWFGVGLIRPAWGPLRSLEDESALDPIRWMDHDPGLAKARSEKRPAFLDFTAKWCASCKEMDRHVLHHPDALRELERFVPIKVDCTKGGGPGEKLLREHGFPGLPSYAFYDSQGNLLKDRGFTGEKPLGEFLELLRSIR